jgi:hypothetical protein
LLGWLNFGRAGWLTAWVHDVVLLIILPAETYIYWHCGFIVAGVALALSLYLWRQSAVQSAKVWSVVHGITLAMYVVIGIIFAVLGIRPEGV